MKAFYCGEGTAAPPNPADLVDEFTENNLRAEASTGMRETLDTRRAEPRTTIILGWVTCLVIALYFPVLLKITLG